MTTATGRRPMVLGLLIALLASVLIAIPPLAPASASTGLHIAGQGFGHGIGMSQYGARYRAEDGHTWRQIVSAYYPGTTSAKGSDLSLLRVRVESDSDGVTTVRSEPGLVLRTSLGSAKLPSTVSGGTPSQWRIRVSGGALIVEALVGGAWRGSGQAAVTAILKGRGAADFVAPDGTVRLVLGSTHREYVGVVRGTRPTGSSSVRTVVVTRFADYLPSVVAAEMPSSWATEALRAQAVAARTYAMFEAAAKPSTSYYDTCDTTSCQVFRGRADYTASGSLVSTWSVATTAAATSATAGRYQSYAGGPAFTQFSASNGGHSVAGSRPYLTAAPDPYDGFPRWEVELSASDVARAFPTIGEVRSVVVSRDGRGAFGGRATTVRLIGDEGSTSVSGSTFRSVLGLRSALVDVSVSGASSSSRDVDGDGRADLLTVSSAGRVYLWRGDGAQSGGSPSSLGGAWTGKRQVTTVVDLSGSGRIEIIARENRSNDLVAYPIGRDGKLLKPRTVHGGDWSGYDLFIGLEGFEGDGDPGLLARTRDGKLYYFADSGRGTLGARTLVSSWWHNIRLATAAGDWDRDGHVDVVALDEYHRLWLYPGDGDGGFETRVLLSSSSGWGDRTSLVGGADWDGDGLVDLMSMTTNGTLMLNGSSSSGGVLTGRKIDSGWTVHELLG